MKILELHLMAFGPFEGTSLDLHQGNHGLHIIYGPNEAGKSSALRAIRQIFFGIPVRSPDNFRHPHNKMRIGATIRHSSGNVLKFIRRKGTKHTLRKDDDETILDDNILETYLKGIDANLFSTMFGIGHRDLVEGGREIISGGGNLGQIIFAAASGITGLRKVQIDLQDAAESLFKPTGKIPKINESILKIKENRKKLRDSQLASGEWSHHDNALQSALKGKIRIEAQLNEARTEKNRLERIRQALPIISQRRELMKDLNQYMSAVLLPDDFSNRRREHIANLRIAQNDQVRAAENIRQIRMEINRLDVSNNILTHSDEIEHVYQELGGYLKATRDRIQLQTRMEVLRSEAKQILHDLRDDLTLDDADTMRLSKKQTLHIQDLGSRYERIITLIDSARERIPGLEYQINGVVSRLDTMNTPRSMKTLYDAVENAAEFASEEKQCMEELAENRENENSLKNELKRQRFWSGTLDDLESLAIPSVETIDTFENELTAATRSLEMVEESLNKTKSELLSTVKKIEELKLNFSVPTESDLMDARKKRDDNWQFIDESLNSQSASDTGSNDFSKRFISLKDYFRTFETHMLQADDISDRLRREADRVATLAKLIFDKSDSEKNVQDLTDELTKQQTNREKIASEWKRLWSASGILPGSPKEMRAWAARQGDITDRFTDIRKRKSRLGTRINAVENQKSKITEIFSSITEPLPDDCETLSHLIKHSRKILDAEQKLYEHRKQLETEKSQKQDLLAELKIQVQENEKELLRWQQRWEQAVAPIGLDADSIPAHAGVLIEDLKRLFDKLKEAEVLQKRIIGIDRDAGAFQSLVLNAVNNLAPDLAGHPAEKATVDMDLRLKEARTAYSKKQTLESQMSKENLRIQQSDKTIMDLKSLLKIMCDEAGCLDYNDLPDAERRSAKRRELESGLNSVEEQLIKLSAGASIDNFVKASLSVEPDRINSEIENYSENIDRLLKEKSLIDQTIGSEQSELSKMDGSSRAAELAEETQTLLGGLEKDVEDYARHRIAAAVLNLAIERYREKNQSPVLQKAGAFFSDITCGSFDGIRAEFDESGTPLIAGVRKNGKELINVEGMSEGTADQLYLALRLSGLEAYLENNEPVPLIVDDILIKFDDIRAKATLETLAALSEKTQILFFTHHRHLVELAKQHIDPSLLINHSLNGRI